MAFCTHCGSTLKPDSKFCTTCGRATAGSDATVPSPQVTAPDATAVPASLPASVPRRRGTAWLIAAAALVAAAALGAAVLFVFQSAGSEDPAAASAAPPSTKAADAPPTTAGLTSTSASPDPAELDTEAIAAALAAAGIFVEDGAAVDEVAAGRLVDELRTTGEQVNFVVLSTERSQDAAGIASEIALSLGDGVVLVVAPGTVGVSGTGVVFTDDQLASALAAATQAASDAAALDAFAGVLVAAAQPATTTTAAPVIAVLGPAEITALASSVLPPTADYSPELMLDGLLETAWNHCGTGCDDAGEARQGIGTTLTFLFDREVNLTGIRVANGYQKISDSIGDVWPKNNRVRSVTATTAGGLQFFELEDERGYQLIRFEPVATDYLVLDIDAVYEGDGTFNDLALSEIEFLVEIDQP